MMAKGMAVTEPAFQTAKGRRYRQPRKYTSMNALSWRAMGEFKLKDFNLRREFVGEPWVATARAMVASREFRDGQVFEGHGVTAQEAAMAMIAQAEKTRLRIGSRL